MYEENLWIFDQKKIEKRDRERNWRDRQKKKKIFKKVKSDFYMFLKFEIRSVKRNRNTHENRLNWSKGIRQESKEPETFKRKSYFSPLHFDRSKNKLDQSNCKETEILKKSWKYFLQNHLINYFYDMAWIFMTSNDLQNQNF